MQILKISKGGQISVPAEIRHRWGTMTVEVEDRGDEFVVRPATDDPVAAVRGVLVGTSLTSDAWREEQRASELAREEERHRR